MPDDRLEIIKHEGEIVAILVKAGFDQPGIHFVTPPNLTQQVAFMKHPQGKTIVPHKHNLVHREVVVTQETLYVRKGRLRVDLYTDDQEFLDSRTLTDGDLIVLCAGGHGFEMLEETSILEVKQGPFAGPEDKVRFEVHKS